mmetsp:Transcript_28912/g.68238  ORF Transcript_28912/g.68238 Transcript_28912/m.68238 type:complete len:199 (+) Transcript_28912:38-634(+)
MPKRTKPDSDTVAAADAKGKTARTLLGAGFTRLRVQHERKAGRVAAYVILEFPQKSQVQEPEFDPEFASFLRSLDDKDEYDGKPLAIAGFPECLAGQTVACQLTCYLNKARKRQTFTWAACLKASDWKEDDLFPNKNKRGSDTDGPFLLGGGMGQREGKDRTDWLPIFQPKVTKIVRIGESGEQVRGQDILVKSAAKK